MTPCVDCFQGLTREPTQGIFPFFLHSFIHSFDSVKFLLVSLNKETVSEGSGCVW